MNGLNPIILRRRVFRAIAGLMVFSFLLSPFVAAMARSPVGKIDDVVVLQAGQGAGGENCTHFRPTPKEVRRFFERTIVISGRQQHDYFEYGPCYAQGTLTTAFGDWTWEMRNLGTGELRSISDEVFLVADPFRQSSLGEGD